MTTKYTIHRRRFLKYLSHTPLFLALGPNACSKKEPELVIRFGMVTDSHYADREVGGTRYYREALSKMEDCVTVMNKEAVSFLIHLGDFKDQDKEPTEAKTLQYLQELGTN